MQTPDFMPTLSRGGHRNAEEGACVMEYISFITGDKWTDMPMCTPVSLARIAQRANDYLYHDDERSRLMLPLMSRLIGQGRNRDFDVMLGTALYREGREHLRPFLADYDDYATKVYASLGAAFNLLRWTEDSTMVVSEALNALIYRRFVPSTGEEFGHYYHEKLLWALDEYDKFVGREKVEDLTEEQVTKVRVIHDLVTS